MTFDPKRWIADALAADMDVYAAIGTESDERGLCVMGNVTFCPPGYDGPLSSEDRPAVVDELVRIGRFYTAPRIVEKVEG